MGSLGSYEAYSGFLLDTHTFIWAIRQPQRLGKLAKAVIEDTANRLYLSSISAYEITNKLRIGRLDQSYSLVVDGYMEFSRRLGVEDMPVTAAHAHLAGNMEWEHRDPFDRMLVAQALLENLALLTDDSRISDHPGVADVW